MILVSDSLTLFRKRRLVNRIASVTRQRREPKICLNESLNSHLCRILLEDLS